MRATASLTALDHVDCITRKLEVLRIGSSGRIGCTCSTHERPLGAPSILYPR